METQFITLCSDIEDHACILFIVSKMYISSWIYWNTIELFTYWWFIKIWECIKLQISVTAEVAVAVAQIRLTCVCCSFYCIIVADSYCWSISKSWCLIVQPFQSSFRELRTYFAMQIERIEEQILKREQRNKSIVTIDRLY